VRSWLKAASWQLIPQRFTSRKMQIRLYRSIAALALVYNNVEASATTTPSPDYRLSPEEFRKMNQEKLRIGKEKRESRDVMSKRTVSFDDGEYRIRKGYTKETDQWREMIGETR
ncbi:hypothetical protein FOZ62_005585, partial [Perkinsus olseni]